jgi:protein arginine N-methyltransferase 7
MNQDVAAACAAAKYNESILVTISLSEYGSSCAPDVQQQQPQQTILLVASLDKENGGIQWNDVSALENPIERHLRTKIWILPMLNDHRRNRLYQEAIQRASQDVINRWSTTAAAASLYDDKNVAGSSDEDGSNNNRISNPNQSNCRPRTTAISNFSALHGSIIRGVDIGSGTGLLAMMSAKYLKESFDESILRRRNDNHDNDTTTAHSASGTNNISTKISSSYYSMKNPYRIHITSLEMSSPMAILAQEIVALNGYNNTIEIATAVSDGRNEQQRRADENDQDRSCVEVTIDVIEAHSCTVQPMQQLSFEDIEDGTMTSVTKTKTGALLCTSELLESGLLGEGWIPAMRDAWDRHLDPINSIVIPQRARVYAQVVEGEGVSNYWGPHKTIPMMDNQRINNEERSPTQDCDDNAKATTATVLRLYTTVNQSGMLSDGSYDDDGNKDGIQVPIHLDRLLADGMVCSGSSNENGSTDHNNSNNINNNNASIRLLSDPIEVMDFDVTSKDSIPLPGRRRSQSISFTPTASGRAQGVVFWWEVDLYQDLTYTTKPGESSSWQDHWHQCLYVFPQPAEECVSLVQGKHATIISSHTDTRLHFSVRKGDDDYEKENDDNDDDNNIPRSDQARMRKRSRPTITEEIPVVTPHRCWQLNDVGRSLLLRDWVQAALDMIGKDRAIVLDISDFSLCGMMASLLGARKVTSVESSLGNLPLASASVAQLANGLVPPSQHNLVEEYDRTNTFQVIQCHAESLTVGHLHNSEDIVVVDGATSALLANLVVGEPYYEMLEGWCIEEALNFYYTLRMLRRQNVVSTSATCVPARASIMACGIECPDIASAYQPCEGYLAGFDHTPVREYCHFAKHNLSLPLWEYNVTPMTEPIEVALLDYEQNRIVLPTSSFNGNRRRQDESEISAKGEDREEDGSELENVTPSIPVEIPYVRAGTCHAVMLWVEYGSSSGVDGGGSSGLQILSTNTRSYKQAVRMLLEPIPVHSSQIGTLSLALSVRDIIMDL